MIVMDTFTKYAILIPMRRQDETTTANALFYEVFMTRGFPNEILSDKGSNYMSAVVTRLCTLMQIHKVNTSPYNPQSNGKNENSHRFLLKIVKILCEKDPTGWVHAGQIATFNWNVSSSNEVAHYSPYELEYGQSPRLPHSVQLALHDDRIDEINEQNYGNYADQLDAKLAQSQSDFREAKYRAHINRNAKINAKFRDVANTRWLQPGKLVIVYRPPNRNSDAPVSSKLLMQFTGPFRIEKIVRSAVHLKNLDGTPADTQNVRNVYPYNRENDHILQDFDHALLDDDDRDKFEAGDMCIVDLTDDDGPPNWGLAKITAVLVKDEFDLHWFGTYSKAKSLARRAYHDAPAYTQRPPPYHLGHIYGSRPDFGCSEAPQGLVS